jgi:hypothetical protein
MTQWKTPQREEGSPTGKGRIERSLFELLDDCEQLQWYNHAADAKSYIGVSVQYIVTKNGVLLHIIVYLSCCQKFKLFSCLLNFNYSNFTIPPQKRNGFCPLFTLLNKV